MRDNWMLRGTRMLEAAQGKFVASENLRTLVLTGLLSMVPTFEGRYAVTVMLSPQLNMPAGFAYLFALFCSSIPIPIILLLLRPVLDWFYTLPIRPVRAFAAWLERRSARKREKMNARNARGIRGKLKGKLSEEALELLGLYIFVALPLPGTGVWTGSAIATLFEMPRLKSGIVILLGNATACAIMTLTTLAARGVISII